MAQVNWRKSWSGMPDGVQIYLYSERCKIKMAFEWRDKMAQPSKINGFRQTYQNRC